MSDAKHIKYRMRDGYYLVEEGYIKYLQVSWTDAEEETPLTFNSVGRERMKQARKKASSDLKGYVMVGDDFSRVGPLRLSVHRQTYLHPDHATFHKGEDTTFAPELPGLDEDITPLHRLG